MLNLDVIVCIEVASNKFEVPLRYMYGETVEKPWETADA
jgi:hypothetical protein